MYNIYSINIIFTERVQATAVDAAPIHTPYHVRMTNNSGLYCAYVYLLYQSHAFCGHNIPALPLIRVH